MVEERTRKAIGIQEGAEEHSEYKESLKALASQFAQEENGCPLWEDGDGVGMDDESLTGALRGFGAPR